MATMMDPDALRAAQKAAALIAHRYEDRREDVLAVALDEFEDDAEFRLGLYGLSMHAISLLSAYWQETPAAAAQRMANSFARMADDAEKGQPG